MPTTDLKLDTPGTLARPGPVGRLVRLAAGGSCQQGPGPFPWPHRQSPFVAPVQLF